MYIIYIYSPNQLNTCCFELNRLSYPTGTARRSQRVPLPFVPFTVLVASFSYGSLCLLDILHKLFGIEAGVQHVSFGLTHAVFFLVTSFGQLSLGVFWAGKTWGIQRRKTWWKLAANKLQNSIHVIDQPICFEPSNFPNIILVLLYPMILSVFVFHMYIAINHKLLLNPPFSMAGQTYPISSPAYHWYNAYMPKQWPEIAQTWPGKSKYLFKHQKNYYTCISLYIHIFNVYIYIYYTVY